MAKRRVLNDVRPGQIWRDRDPRMYSANRRVRVLRTERDGNRCSVYYQQVVGPSTNIGMGREFRSAYDRFQRAFDLVSPYAA